MGSVLKVTRFFSQTPDASMPCATRLDRTLLVLLGVLAGVLITLHHAPPIREWEYRTLDLALRVRRTWAPSLAPEVVLVGVDESTEEAFPEPLSLWHRHLADVMAGLALGNARGVGVDFALPARSQDGIIPGNDFALAQGIRLLRNRAPLVLGVTVDRAFQPRPVLPLFLAAAGRDGSGLVLAPADPDGRLRRFNPLGGPGGSAIQTLAGVLAQRLGAHTRAGLVDFSYGAPFSYVPFHQVAGWKRSGNVQALRAAFSDRVVLVGSVLPREDRHPMAVNLAGWETDFGDALGVTYHAQVLRCLLGRGLLQEVPIGWVWTLSLITALGCWWLGRRLFLGLTLLGTTWGALAMVLLLGLGQGWFLPVLGPAGAGFAALAGRAAWAGIVQARERRWLQQAFSGHVSPAILREILEGRLAPNLAGGRVPICLLFSDIRGFTTLSETMPPEEVITLLNRYFTEMSQVVHARAGTVDKFMGDGLMAFFGAPEPLQNPSLNAFLAAQDMLSALESLNLELTEEGRPSLAIGIGLHHGEAAVGYVGSLSRHQYTAIGDTVNLASRVEGLTKETGYPLLCTRSVYEQVGMATKLQPLGEHPIRGRGPVELFGWRPESEDCLGEEA